MRSMRWPFAALVCLSFAGCGGGGGGGGNPPNPPNPPAPPQAQTITFAQGGPLNVLIDSSTTNLAGGGAGTGATTYASSNTSVVRVDPTLGTASAVGLGSATITATKAADPQYLQAQASYTINVQTLDRVSAWIGANDSLVHLPQQANGKSFRRARMTECSPASLGACPNADSSTASSAPVTDTRAALTHPAYYAIANGATLGAPVEVTTDRFSDRILHGAVYFNGRYWLIGGARPAPGTEPPNVSYPANGEVWSSADARTWKLETSNFGARAGHQTLVYNGYIWVLGGYPWPPLAPAQVWRSPNGLVWEQVTVTTPTAFDNQAPGLPYPAAQMAATTFANQMWIMRSGVAFSSTDGATWTQRGSITDALPREHAGFTSYGGYLWYIAGTRVVFGAPTTRITQNDVWRSQDGVTWEPVTLNAPFAARTEHATFVLNNRLWVLGGRPDPSTDVSTRDAWSTTDGLDWRLETLAVDISRSYLTKVVQEPNRVTIVAGVHRGFSNKVWQSTDGSSWTEMSALAAFTPRLSSGLASFNDDLWVIGGATMEGVDSDEIWRSADGLNWRLVTPSTSVFSPRDGHAVAVFNNRLWVIGGWDNTFATGGTETRLNDVWSSPDGVSWTRHADAPFEARVGHGVAVFGGRLFIIGGSLQSSPANDVWSTADGATWRQETAAAAFSPRRSFSTVTLDSGIYVIGGATAPNGTSGVGNDEVWRSTDGRTWTQVGATAHFAPRMGAAGTTMNGRMYIVGGASDENYYVSTRYSDVWSSADGITWRQDSTIPFQPRMYAGLANHKNTLYVTGGYAFTRFNDVWRSSDGVNWRMGFSHQIDSP